MSLETGFDFLREDHRNRAKEMIKKEKPFFLVIAFPGQGDDQEGEAVLSGDCFPGPRR